MFGKTNYSLCHLSADGQKAFEEIIASYDEQLDPVALLEKLRQEGGSAVALTPYDRPLGGEGVTLNGCDLAEGVYAFWFTSMAETTLQDPNVLKEHLSFTSYGTPFKFLPKEQKQDITDQMETEERTVEQIHVPVILDFNNERLWAATTNKTILEEIRLFLGDREIETGQLVFDFGTNEWPFQILEKIAEGVEYQTEFQHRAEQVKAAGDPKLVEAHEDAVIEKIVKKYFRCLDHDNYLLFLGTPAKLYLSNQATSVGVNNPFDGTEVMNNGLGVASARLTVSERGRERIEDVMSIDVSDVTHIEPGFIVFKGLESHGLSQSIKETGTANGKLTLKDYWLCDFERNQIEVARFVDLVKSLLEIEGDYGIKHTAKTEMVKAEG